MHLQEALWFAALAGIGGTLLGGLLGIGLQRRHSHFLDAGYAFSCGLLLGIAALELFPESVELVGLPSTLWAVVGGGAFFFLCHRISHRLDGGVGHHHHGGHGHAQQAHVGHTAHERQSRRSGVFFAVAIALHNLPEGMAIGAGGEHDAVLGGTLAVLVALHNIPVGIGITTPLLRGGMRRVRALLIAAAAGASTLLGGLFGALLGGLDAHMMGVMLSISAGGLVLLTAMELAPQIAERKQRLQALCLVAAGLAAAALLVHFMH